MPFKSEAQRGFMYAKHPKIAKRFEAETPDNAKLPEHVKKMNKGGIVSDWKDDLAGYMDEHFGKKPGQPQKLAPGGFAGDFDVNMGDSSTIPSPLPAPAVNPAAAPVPNPVFNPKIGLPPEPVSAPIAMPAATAIPPTSPAAGPSGPDPLQDYLSQQSKLLSKYGPEEQLALEQAIQKQRTGLVPTLANAGAGLADAIMQGVARAGPSNFQANLQNRLDKSQEAQRTALEKAQTGHLARMKQEMELAQADPSSPISKMAQKAYGSTLKAMPGGQTLTDAQIALIPASSIADILGKKVDLAKVVAEAENTKAIREQTHEFQMGELGLRGDTLKATIANQKAEQEAKQTQLREGSAKGLQERPWYQKAVEWVPWFRSAATKEMLSQIDSNPNAAEAFEWISQHPNDPRIPSIIKKLATK